MHAAPSPWARPGRFEDRIALITAAASGIGAATARRMAAEGAHIVAVDADAASLERLIAGLPGAPGASGRHLAVVADCLDETAVRSCVDQALAHGKGRIDILVNGVGGSTLRSLKRMPPTGVEDFDLDDWNALVQFNLTPTFLFCKHVAGIMKRQRAGKIVNLTSIAGRGDNPKVGNTAYSTAKSGIVALTKRVAHELGPHGVNCNAVAPGTTQTARIMQYYDGLSAELREAALARVPLGRHATPEDQANAICFLASAEADFITGINLEVTGGQ